MPLTKLLPAEQLAAIVARTKQGGAEIVNLLKTGSAYYAPTASQAEIVRAIAHDEHRSYRSRRTSQESSARRTSASVCRSCWGGRAWNGSSR